MTREDSSALSAETGRLHEENHRLRELLASRTEETERLRALLEETQCSLAFAAEKLERICRALGVDPAQ